MTKKNCDCEKCRRREEKSFPEKVVRSAVNTGLNMAVGYAIGTAVTAATGSPVAGYVAAKAVTGISGPEDLL